MYTFISKETFSITQNPQVYVHESVLNISDNYEINIDHIFNSTKQYDIIAKDDMRLCNSDTCDIYQDIGKMFPGALVETYDPTQSTIPQTFFVVRVKIVVKENIASNSQTDIYIYAQPEFKALFTARICNDARNRCRNVSWSNNNSEPDISFKLRDGAFLQFAKTTHNMQKIF
jgi:hypothetical protein